MPLWTTGHWVGAALMTGGPLLSALLYLAETCWFKGAGSPRWSLARLALFTIGLLLAFLGFCVMGVHGPY